VLRRYVGEILIRPGGRFGSADAGAGGGQRGGGGGDVVEMEEEEEEESM
jgi:hypothetical protein